jgi:hypothetical protein
MMGRTSLTPFASSMADPDPAGARNYAGTLWRQHGIIALFPDQLRDMGGLERQLLEAVAVKHYGKR